MPAPRVNVLGAERSPYLRQHAGNPVPWRPWGDVTLLAMRRAGADILITYAAKEVAQWLKES